MTTHQDQQAMSKVISLVLPPVPQAVLTSGVFYGREKICDLYETIPVEYHEKHLSVKFQSGLLLNCQGKAVEALSRGRK